MAKASKCSSNSRTFSKHYAPCFPAQVAYAKHKLVQVFQEIIFYHKNGYCPMDTKPLSSMRSINHLLRFRGQRPTGRKSILFRGYSPKRAFRKSSHLFWRYREDIYFTSITQKAVEVNPTAKSCAPSRRQRSIIKQSTTPYSYPARITKPIYPTIFQPLLPYATVPDCLISFESFSICFEPVLSPESQVESVVPEEERFLQSMRERRGRAYAPFVKKSKDEMSCPPPRPHSNLDECECMVD
ncbi:hypothetical protein DSO57_1017887 [Entomophthora muscae]|uniref:Uncharacterized protein n=1 Tax=Entomophthora muscae TaxID=34485 RepID=A0ACC2UP99_9FUNG|nr:hypothetical protein DSO57_1017887 [Entomophthora muscae]